MLDITVTGHVAEVTLNRPEKKNALSMELLKALQEAGEALRDDPAVRAVVLTGAGGVFSAGIDLSILQQVAGQMDDIKHQMRNPPEPANLFQKPFTVWREVGVPVIAAIEGICFGAGMQLALAADFRIVAPATRLSIMEAKWGLVPDMGISQYLPGLMRADQAKELVMTGRIFDTAEAQDLGLVTRVAETPLDAARAMAADLAARSPDAIRSAKRLMDATWATDEALLALEAELQTDLMGSPNQMETVFAQMQKRAPVYK